MTKKKKKKQQSDDLARFAIKLGIISTVLTILNNVFDLVKKFIK